MRVIAGTARRLQLVTPRGMETRPTTDRIKETLFNILQNDLCGCRFLDLFAGSGGIGIEALSRGGAEAVFVDNSKEALSCIRENLSKTHLSDRAIVLGQDCVSAIHALDAKKKQFDIIFMDPPYQLGAEKEALAELIKMRNELRKEELMNAVINSSRSYEEILAFVKGEGLTE